jgi:TfoX/Sxy family transcriptional regulator of competence genes
MVQQRPELADRVRALLADRPSVREKPMFGGRSFMVDEKMIASARRNGDLLVRVAAKRRDLAELPGAAPAEMGTGRSMGPGWLTVSADSIADDERLSFWIGVALEHNESAARGGS